MADRNGCARGRWGTYNAGLCGGRTQTIVSSGTHGRGCAAKVSRWWCINLSRFTPVTGGTGKTAGSVRRIFDYEGEKGEEESVKPEIAGTELCRSVVASEF